MAAPAIATVAAGVARRLAPSITAGAVRRLAPKFAAAAAMPLVLVLAAVLTVFGARWEQVNSTRQGVAVAGVGIPTALLPIYNEASRVYHVNAFLLASVHKQETDFSGAPDTFSVNSSGCAGPMQISSVPGSACGCEWCQASVRDAYRRGERPDVYPDEHSPHPSVYDTFDAIMGAAVVLRGKVGGRAIPRLDATAHQALCGYYGACSDGVAGDYAGNVLRRAQQWETASQALAPTTGAGAGSGPLRLTPGERAVILPNGQAAAPASAPPVVQQIIAAGNQIVGRPYVYGGGHGSPVSSVQPSYDCSSSISHLLWGGGLLNVVLASGDLMSWGEAGNGHWISMYSDPGHVYMYVAGIRWDTHGAGVDTGPNTGIGWHYGVRARRPGDAIRHPKGL
ncbi:MAG: hypothetical protein JWQ48_2370 [Conexibacter sp.]|nr:hypothetical protein [Conexibacter sp.]